ncbi:Hypothetical_protein [Hexamita inflata]|uniref:Hypothetical_protein n=1 Tax=Hexamita inflata TaxID=28002 RepID=A0AA86QDT9_9EUKA|nr:Hypothetical protein HINF_LOCUS38859 [Hexamita inflata]
MSVLMRRENTLIIEPGSDISKIQIINFILLPNSKKHFEGPPLYFNKQLLSIINISQQPTLRQCILIIFFFCAVQRLECNALLSFQLFSQNLTKKSSIQLTLMTLKLTLTRFDVQLQFFK